MRRNWYLERRDASQYEVNSFSLKFDRCGLKPAFRSSTRLAQRGVA